MRNNKRNEIFETLMQKASK